MIRLYNEADRDLWNKYVMASNTSTCYHLISWKDVIEGSLGHKTYYLLSENKEKEINGILPLVRLKSLLFGNFMVSLPYFNYAGICSDNREISDQLLNEAINIAKSENAGHIEFRETLLMDKGISVKTTKVSMILELPSESEALWYLLGSKLRSQIRRPIKEGMYSKLGRMEELDNFYKVFSTNMRDLGTPVYSKGFFKCILEAFPSSSWIGTVYTKEGLPTASGFIVSFKETLQIPWASSLKGYNHYSPNMLLYWSLLEFACKKGYKVFDFGRSTPDQGTYRFKEQWGAKPVQLYWYYWMRNGGPLPDFNPENPKYRTAINIWKKLPVGLTRLIGPFIVKNLP